jgi:hypothetical protein
MLGLQGRRNGERRRSKSGFLRGCCGWERHDDTAGKGDGRDPRTGPDGRFFMTLKLWAGGDGTMKTT